MAPILPTEPPEPEERVRVGLCVTCSHAKTVETERSTFYQCMRAATDPRFARYPVLPVRGCPGHEAAPPAAPNR